MRKEVTVDTSFLASFLAQGQLVLPAGPSALTPPTAPQQTVPTVIATVLELRVSPSLFGPLYSVHLLSPYPILGFCQPLHSV